MKLAEAFVLIILAGAMVGTGAAVGIRHLIERYRTRRARWKVTIVPTSQQVLVQLVKYGEEPIAIAAVPHGSDRIYAAQSKAEEEASLLNAS